jgi:glucokinase
MSPPRTAIDIGGTTTRVAADGAVTRFATEPDYDRQLAALVRAAGRPAAVGVSFGGRVDPAGTVRVALNLRAYEGRPLGADLATALGCPVRVAHDATCGLLGEHARGALRGADRCAYVTLSTGVGSALRLGAADAFVVLTTEFGHQLVPGNDRPCACGQVGCLETLTGGRALQQALGRPLETVHDARFWPEYAEALALGLTNFSLSTGVRTVALGGSIVLRRTGLFDLIVDEVSRRSRYQTVKTVKARLGETAPLVGAAVLIDVAASSILH